MAVKKMGFQWAPGVMRAAQIKDVIIEAEEDPEGGTQMTEDQAGTRGTTLMGTTTQRAVTDREVVEEGAAEEEGLPLQEGDVVEAEVQDASVAEDGAEARDASSPVRTTKVDSIHSTRVITTTMKVKLQTMRTGEKSGADWRLVHGR